MGDVMFFRTNDVSLKLDSVFYLSWESHEKKSEIRPFDSLSFRIKGSSDFISCGNENTSPEGSIAYVPAGSQYTIKSTDAALYVIHFLCDSPLGDKIKVFKSENPAYFERKFKDIYEIWLKKQPGFEYECKSILYKILSRIESENEKKKFSDINDSIKDALDFIHERYADGDVSVDELARMSGMSDTYFRKIFIKKFSVTPKKYINNLRLGNAVELLKSGYYTVSEVSDKCGFNNVYYFSSFIKKLTGNVPSYYLNKNAE